MRKNLTNGSVDINDKLGLLERTVKLIAKYGIFRVFSGLAVLIMFGLTLGLFINQEKIVNRFIDDKNKKETEEHSNRMELRLNQINPQVDAILLKLLIETGANRVFVIEMHNGSNNPTGLPFVYGEITYEQIIDPQTPPIADEYGTINMSRYSFADNIYRNGIFKGSIEELSKIDTKLANRMQQNDVKYVYMTTLTGTNTTIGFLGMSYSTKVINCNADGKILTASQKISVLLDLYNSSK
jgi:hypothetical protein